MKDRDETTDRTKQRGVGKDHVRDDPGRTGRV